RIGNTNESELSFIDRGHQTVFVRGDGIICHGSERSCNHRVEEIRSAASQIVRQIAYDSFGTGTSDYFIAKRFRNTELLPMAECIRFTIFFDCVALPLSAF